VAHVFTFRSQQFQPADEQPNPINPIAGEGLLIWLATQLKARGYDCDVPDAEDWGWYTAVTNGAQTYLLGASGDWASPGASTEWTVQLEVNRSLWNKLSGANKMLPNDAVSAAVERVLLGNPEVVDLEVERGA
jgi:hypothetical protein